MLLRCPVNTDQPSSFFVHPTVPVTKAHILCYLLMILLTEPLLAEHLGDSPRQAAA
jgi:hypothetical protein